MKNEKNIGVVLKKKKMIFYCEMMMMMNQWRVHWLPINEKRRRCFKEEKVDFLR